MIQMQVTYFHRKRRGGANFSIEQIFAEIRQQLGDRIESRVWVAPFLSNGFFRRVAIAVTAWVWQSDVNHVTGDINFVAILLAPERTLLTNHDCVFLDRTRGWRRTLLKWIWLELPIRRVRYVTTVSAESRRVLLEHVKCDPGKVIVVHNPVSPKFQYCPKPFPEREVRILQLGTAPNKNLARLIPALAGLDCVLIIVGVLSDAIVQLAKNEGVQMVNYVDLAFDEVIEQYELCDIVSFVSLAEGFGMPIIEANAVGRPVVTSMVSSMPEVAGDAACLVDPSDVASIRGGFQRVMSDDAYRSQLIANGLENVKRFSVGRIAGEYLHLYNRVVAIGGR